MPHTLKPLPPDDPIFSLRVGFVFRSELPKDDEGFGQAARFLRRLRASSVEHEQHQPKSD